MTAKTVYDGNNELKVEIRKIIGENNYRKIIKGAKMNTEQATYNNGFLRQEDPMRAVTPISRAKGFARKRYTPEHEKKIIDFVSPLVRNGSTYRTISDQLNNNGLKTANDREFTADIIASFLYDRGGKVRKSFASTQPKTTPNPLPSTTLPSSIDLHNRISYLREENEKLKYDFATQQRIISEKDLIMRMTNEKSLHTGYMYGGFIGAGLMGMIWILVSVGGHFIR